MRACLRLDQKELAMTASSAKAKMANMMGLSVTFGQVLAAFVVVLPTTVGIVTFLNTNFQTKDEARLESERVNKRVDAVEATIETQSKLQAQIFGEVKDISGYLRAKSEKR